MATEQPTRSEREWSPAVIAITLGTPGLMLLFGLIWVASRIGKLHSLPTIAVWATIPFAFALFALGIVEIVMYHYDYHKSVWRNFWIAVEGIGIACEVFVIAWAYRSPDAHALVVSGGVLMVQGWVLYGYHRKVSGKLVTDEPHVPFIEMAAILGLAGGTISWLFEHPPAAAFMQMTAQPATATDPPSGAAMLGTDIGKFLMVVGGTFVAIGIAKLVRGVAKFLK